MPLYVYEPNGDGCDHCAEGFEVLQGVRDEPLTKCPECGRPCHRVISPFAPIKSSRDTLSPKNLESKGFTQYKRAGDGIYEKTAGKGPRTISRD